MATEEAERGPGSSAVGAHVASPQPTPAPSHLRRVNRPLGARRNSEQLPRPPASEVGCNHGDTWRRPSPRPHRTFSYDHASSKGEGSFLDGERATGRPPPGQSMKGVSAGVARLARRGPESPLGQLDVLDDDDDDDDNDEAWASARQRAVIVHCACPVSRLHANCNHSPGSNSNRRSNASTKSNMSPAHSPASNRSPLSNVSPAVGGCRANARPRSRPTQHFHRRSSLPAFMLASLKDGYSSLERLNRRPRVGKTSLEKLHHWRLSLDKEPWCLPAARGSEAGGCRGKEEEEEEEEEEEVEEEEEDEGVVAEGDSTFVRNRKERSTVLVRRFFKNNQQVSKPVCTGTRAIVRALPSGRPSTEVWRQVVQHQSSRPVRELVWGVLERLRAEGERLNVCRGMRRFVGVKHLKVVW
ncbi:unnamed protein product [Arctogadus glacialis]